MIKIEKEKHTITELVNKSKETNTIITGALANAHLLTEYYKELKHTQLGIKIKEKITEKEFQDLITKYKNKEV